MGFSLVTAATSDPVTVADAKEYCRIDESADDGLVATLVSAATAYAQEVTKRQFVTATYKLNLHAFPQSGDYYLNADGWGWRHGRIMLPYPPAQSVTHVKYYDLNNVQQTLSTDVYELATNVDPSEIRLKYGQSWPGALNRRDTIEIQYVTGYGAIGTVPDAIKTAIMMHVSLMYDNREPIPNVGSLVSSGHMIQLTYDSLLTPYKVPCFV